MAAPRPEVAVIFDTGWRLEATRDDARRDQLLAGIWLAGAMLSRNSKPGQAISGKYSISGGVDKSQ